MTEYVERGGLQVASELAALAEGRILKDVSAEAFWAGYASMLRDMIPENTRLLAKRDDLQLQIDHWHRCRPDNFDQQSYTAFLTEIGYLLPEAEPTAIDVTDVDAEIASVADPQLVVPVTNARFALNAANARWGSLYDALYGTNAIPGAANGPGYDAERGAQVIAWVRSHLDKVAPLALGNWADVTGFAVEGGKLTIATGAGATTLAAPAQFAGNRASGDVLLRVNGLLIEIVIDATSAIGATDKAHISDVRLESALTAIQDCEDSVAAVYAPDKCAVYANWLGLMSGDMAETFTKGGREVTRRLSDDLTFLDPAGQEVSHPGRALLLVRNVGHLMTTDAVTLDGQETPEGIMDAIMTVAASVHDLSRTEGARNSREGSIYIVKPKMHGPEEVAFANRNAGQSILGYIVHWVDQGLGCSKVPDINDVALMEDRATLRISAQYLANWILHGVCSAEDIEASFRRMAPKVDAQNAGDAAYRPRSPGFDGVAFNAARDQVLKGVSQPSGYTEPLLHAARRRAKQAA